MWSTMWSTMSLTKSGGLGDPALWPGAGFRLDDGVDVFLRPAACAATGNVSQATVRVRPDHVAGSMPCFFNIVIQR